MPASPRRQRQPAVTRARILEAALETASEGGAANFTLDRVLARLSISKGALIHHFPSKLALLTAMLDHVADLFMQQAQALAARDPEPYARNARAYLHATITGFGPPANVNLARVALIACLLEPSLTTRWAEKVGPLFDPAPSDRAEADDSLIFRLMADGLWLTDILTPGAIPADQRQALMHLFSQSPRASAE